MGKRLSIIAIGLAFAALTGCATTGELEKVQSQQQLDSAKADQAVRDAQAAKAAADAAKLQADAAAARVENAIKLAEEREKAAAEREKAADEKAAKAEAIFQRSMRK
ncbi:Lpp/OprI family alanine-zipper lipoprotein [Geotalea sp. SG265]|uniref:Lpp/OprI family alanine-zipper lipoprotein n=1 Tax=Geotalea sp. SG265 TaxID=2922867 RepID=UPI001FAFE069|nr:Lpp/OprI family alanine-zipper lipoprotein [Geotalea sp. SG265]